MYGWIHLKNCDVNISDDGTEVHIHMNHNDVTSELIEYTGKMVFVPLLKGNIWRRFTHHFRKIKRISITVWERKVT